MKDFEGLKYYKIDYPYRVNGSLIRFNDGITFSVNITGGDVYDHLIYEKALLD